MLVFTIRRLFVSIPVLLVSTVVIFFMVASSVDPMAQYATKKGMTQAQKAALAHHYGLDKSLIQRYWDWLTGVFLHGSFGTSVQPGFKIGQQLGYAIGVTLRLVLGTILIALILGVVVGVVTAVRQYSRLDYFTTTIGFLFLSLPTFWFAVLLKEWAIQLNGATGIHIPTLWEQTTPQPSGFFPQIADDLSHMILPVVTLALLSYAVWSRFQRASMLEVLGSDYMRLARAKGLSPSRVLIRHGLRNALIPLATQVALDTAGLLSGAIITETIFSWNGMGRFFIYDGIQMADPNSVMAWLLLAGSFIIIMNLIADLLYAVLDPRIRLA